jgi:hypothetical protein
MSDNLESQPHPALAVPDVVLTIAEFMRDEEQYGTLASLEVASRFLQSVIQPIWRKVKKRAVLDVDDLRSRNTSDDANIE